MLRSSSFLKRTWARAGGAARQEKAGEQVRCASGASCSCCSQLRGGGRVHALTHRLNARDGLHYRRLAVRHMANGACRRKHAMQSKACREAGGGGSGGAAALGNAASSPAISCQRIIFRLRPGCWCLKPASVAPQCAPMLMVACREMTSGDSGVSLLTSKVARSCSRQWHDQPAAGIGRKHVRGRRARLLSEPLPLGCGHCRQAWMRTIIDSPCDGR